jgi:hypothetical protein
VPKSNGALLRGAYLMPRAAAEWVGRTMGTDKLMTEVDRGARAAYEDRVVHSGGDGAPADPSAPAEEAAPSTESESAAEDHAAH